MAGSDNSESMVGNGVESDGDGCVRKAMAMMATEML